MACRHRQKEFEVHATFDVIPRTKAKPTERNVRIPWLGTILSELVDNTPDQQIRLIFIYPHASEKQVDSKICQDSVPNQLSQIAFD